MRLRHTSPVIALMVSLASVGYVQPGATIQNPDTPGRAEWDSVVADFSARIWDYFELRRELEKGLPALTVTDDPAEISRAVSARADRIRLARTDAQQVTYSRRPLVRSSGRRSPWKWMPTPGPPSWTTILGNSQFGLTAPIRKEHRSLRRSPNILAALPRLPDDIEYRFVGRHLILLDMRASHPRPDSLRNPVAGLRRLY